MTIDPVGVDLYALDVNGDESVAALIAAGAPWSFIVAKASEGTYYDGGAWLKALWQAALATDRYGETWFRGAYTYLRADEDGVAQADYFLGCVARAGGWSSGDLWPILDFERGEQPANVSAQQVIDVLSAAAARVKAVTGRAPMRYTGELFRSLGIVDPCGCPLLWCAEYGAALSPKVYTDQGYTLANTWGWQYRGTSPQAAGPKGYPMTAPVGPGGAAAAVDLTAIIVNGGGDPSAQLSWTKAHLVG
jgi:GH25 family lysozyme M1 (1,4-beta-N-acetylmuramidase)